MRYPEGHKASVRAGIVAAASRALRQDGLAGVSIPALMKKAGLTHGAFYVHFSSRDALVAAAVEAAAAETAENVLSEKVGGLEATLEAYLSMPHVENPARGCVLAALGSEGRDQPKPVRSAFSRTAQGFLHLLQKKTHPRGSAARLSDDTLALAARMVGAVILARLVDDADLANRILAAARRA